MISQWDDGNGDLDDDNATANAVMTMREILKSCAITREVLEAYGLDGDTKR